MASKRDANTAKSVTLASERYVQQIMSDGSGNDLKMPTESLVREGHYSKTIAKRLKLGLELNKGAGYRIHITSEHGPAHVKAGSDLLTRLAANVRDTEKKKTLVLLPAISEYFKGVMFDKGAQDKLPASLLNALKNNGNNLDKPVKAQTLLDHLFRIYPSGDDVLVGMDAMHKAMLAQIKDKSRTESAAIEVLKSKLANSTIALEKAHSAIFKAKDKQEKPKQREVRHVEKLPAAILAFKAELATREPAYNERAHHDALNKTALIEDWESGLRKNFIKILCDRHLDPVDLNDGILAVQSAYGIVDDTQDKYLPETGRTSEPITKHTASYATDDKRARKIVDFIPSRHVTLLLDETGPFYHDMVSRLNVTMTQTPEKPGRVVISGPFHTPNALIAQRMLERLKEQADLYDREDRDTIKPLADAFCENMILDAPGIKEILRRSGNRLNPDISYSSSISAKWVLNELFATAPDTGALLKDVHGLHYAMTADVEFDTALTTRRLNAVKNEKRVSPRKKQRDIDAAQMALKTSLDARLYLEKNWAALQDLVNITLEEYPTFSHHDIASRLLIAEQQLLTPSEFQTILQVKNRRQSRKLATPSIQKSMADAFGVRVFSIERPKAGAKNLNGDNLYDPILVVEGTDSELRRATTAALRQLQSLLHINEELQLSSIIRDTQRNKTKHTQKLQLVLTEPELRDLNNFIGLVRAEIHVAKKSTDSDNPLPELDALQDLLRPHQGITITGQMAHDSFYSLYDTLALARQPDLAKPQSMIAEKMLGLRESIEKFNTHTALSHDDARKCFARLERRDIIRRLGVLDLNDEQSDILENHCFKAIQDFNLGPGHIQSAIDNARGVVHVVSNEAKQYRAKPLSDRITRAEKQAKTDLFFIPTLVEGRAVDNSTTKKRHQLMSICYDRIDRLYRLDYSISCPNMDRSPDNLIVANFADMAARRNQDDVANHSANKAYDDLLLNLAGNCNTEPFTKNEYRPALTFSFIFNPDDHYKIIDYFISRTQAKMSDYMDYDDANLMLTRRRRDRELTLWRNVIAAQNLGTATSSKNFQQVVEETSILVQNVALETAYAENIDTLVRVKSKEPNAPVSFVTTDLSRAIDDAAYQRKMMITSTTYEDSLLNGAFLGFFRLTGKNLFSPDIMTGIAGIRQERFAREMAPARQPLVNPHPLN